jgi:hypothetical protein
MQVEVEWSNLGENMNKVALLGVGVAVAVTAVAALTYQHSADVPLANPPQGNKCTSSPCQAPISTTSSFWTLWHCKVSAGVARLVVPKNTVVSWTLQPIDGDRVEFYDPAPSPGSTSGYIVINADTKGDFVNRTVDSSNTTVTWTASGVASEAELGYTVYARRVKGSGSSTDFENCWAANPLIVNVPQ